MGALLVLLLLGSSAPAALATGGHAPLARPSETPPTATPLPGSGTAGGEVHQAQRPEAPAFPFPAPRLALPSIPLTPAANRGTGGPDPVGGVVSSRLATGSADAPVRWAAAPANITLNGSMVLAIDTDAVVGNITLADNASLYVYRSAPSSPTTLTVRGNIQLSGNSSLLLNRTDLAIDESYDVEWTMTLTGTSRLGMLGGNLTTNGYQWGAAYEGQSNATFVDSFVGYPSGWVDSELVGAASLNLYASWYASDVILFDNAFAPSTSRFYAEQSAAFNVWLTFKSGITATVTLPGRDAWENWTFPGNASAAGVKYTIDLVDCFVQIWGVMDWQGAQLSVANSPDVAVALDEEYGPVALSGLTQGRYVNGSVQSNGFDVGLVNATVFTWNLYVFAGALSVGQSEVGEIQVFGSAAASVTSGVLTGAGGYYGEQGSGTLAISAALIAGSLVGYSGTITVANSTFHPVATSEILATGTAVIYLDNSTLVGPESYQRLGAGSLFVAWTVAAVIDRGGLPAVAAATVVAFAGNLTAAARGYSGGRGQWAGMILAWEENASGSSTFSYVLTASVPGYGAEAPLSTLWEATTVPLNLTALVVGSTPANGATNVSTDVGALQVTFAFPMDTNVVGDPVTLVPAPVGGSASWTASDLTLSFNILGSLEANTSFTATVNGSLLTADGLPLGTAFAFTFRTAAAPLAVPQIYATAPADRATGVGVNATVEVSFSLSMNLSSLVAAFSISPAAAGTATAIASQLQWTPGVPLSANTTYVVQISTVARSDLGVPLAAPFSFYFTTAPATGSSQPPPSENSTNHSRGGLAPAPPGPWTTYALLGIAAIVIAAVLGLVWVRRRQPPARAGPPSPPPVAVPPPWAEGPPEPRGPAT